MRRWPIWGSIGWTSQSSLIFKTSTIMLPPDLPSLWPLQPFLSIILPLTLPLLNTHPTSLQLSKKSFFLISLSLSLSVAYVWGFHSPIGDITAFSSFPLSFSISLPCRSLSGFGSRDWQFYIGKTASQPPPNGLGVGDWQSNRWHYWFLLLLLFFNCIMFLN